MEEDSPDAPLPPAPGAPAPDAGLPQPRVENLDFEAETSPGPLEQLRERR